MSLEINGSSFDKSPVGFEAFGSDSGFATTRNKKDLELLQHAQEIRNLQVRIGEGNINGSLVSSQ